MIKRLLVPLDLSEYTKAAVETACDLALAHHAEIEGLAIVESTFDVGVQPEQKQALENFDEICKSRGTRHRGLPLGGVPTQLIRGEACTSDLVVMGIRTHYPIDKEDDYFATIARMLDATPTPVLAVPEDGSVRFDKVLIAYNGSLPSAHALRAFAQVAHPLDDPEITIVSSDADRNEAESHVRDAAGYLRAYDFGNIRTVTTSDEIYDHVAREHLDHTDLIVAGVHSKHPLRDFFVGSFATGLIELGRVPLLLAH